MTKLAPRERVARRVAVINQRLNKRKGHPQSQKQEHGSKDPPLQLPGSAGTRGRPLHPRYLGCREAITASVKALVPVVPPRSRVWCVPSR
jgi:hypothetical protein